MRIIQVEDSKWGSTVNGKVTVTVKEITDEAVDNSGSIRFMGTTKEAFIIPDLKTVFIILFRPSLL